MALAAVDGIIGVKDSGGDFLATQSLLTRVRDVDGFSVLQGFDQLAAVSILAGADGIVTAVGCFMPGTMVELAKAARAGDLERTFALQRDVLDTLDRLAWDSDSAFIRGVKTCLEALGLCSADIVAPFAAATDEERTHVREVLRGVVEPALESG